jgi:catechol 2,3-dioxygenase-like lactoylglutathione lyase family enzyme
VTGIRVDRLVFVVPTTMLEESLGFYRDGIGLRVLEEWTDMGRGALLAASDQAHVELIEMDAVPESEEPRVALGLQIAGVDAVYERLTALGARIKAPPRARAWGMYGFGAFDPNGVPVNVYEPTH